MTTRLTISIWAAIATVILPAGVVLGQEVERLPETALSTSIAVEAATPTFTQPASTPFEVPPVEIAPTTLPQKDDFNAGGFGGFGMGGLGMGGPGYGATWNPSRPASGAAPGESLGLVRQNLSAAMPLWRDGGDVLMFSAGVRNSMFFTDVIMPDSHRPFPSDLWDVHFGTNYLHKFDNGWSGGVGVNFGSASDKPFHSINEMTIGFNSFLQVPARNERDLWRFSLMYSPVGNLTFPIPGIAYIWNPSDTLRLSIGLPLALNWRPVEDLTLNMSYIPLTTVNARATYRVVGKVYVFGGFEWVQEAYLLADRENLSDRFLGYEKRLIGGVRCDVWQHATLEMNAGYAFDRFYGIGQNQITNLHDQVDVASGAFISTSLRIRF